MIVVSNATPLIALAKINRLALLQELFGSIRIPQPPQNRLTLRRQQIIIKALKEKAYDAW